MSRYPHPADMNPDSSDPRSPYYDSSRDERIAEASEELADQYRNNPEKCREAEEWVAGTFEGDHYSALTLALHRLHHTDPSALVGSDLLTTLYRLAKVEAAAMDAELLEMARREVEGGA